MNKLFGKSKKTREEKKRQKEQREENDFLYGRSSTKLISNPKLRPSNPHPNRVDSALTDESAASMNTNYHRGESDVAVSHVPGASAASAASMGGGTSGMSQEDIDKATKQRLKNERRKQSSAARKSTFEDRLRDSAFAGSHDDNDWINEEDEINVEERPKKSELKKERKSRHRSDKDDDPEKEERRRRRRAEREFARKSGTKGDHKDDNEHDEVEERRRRHRDQDEKDRKMKQSIREQRDIAKSMRSGGTNTNGDEELDERRRRQRDQAEKDRKMKQSIRQQRDAAKTARASGYSDGSNDDELEERRRRQRDQAEKDRKMKQSIRQQRDVAKSMRSGGTSYSSSSYDQKQPPQKQSYEDDYGKVRSIKDNGNSYDRGREQCEDEQGDTKAMNQNLIDLHLAQFRATAKIGDNDDDEDYDYFDDNCRLSTLEQEEIDRNSRRQDKRLSTTTMKINAWQQKYSLKMAIQLAERTPEQEWVSSFYRSDPRWQIMKFFDEVAREGGEAPMDEDLAASPLASLFNKANVFTVWRPTSDEAIKNMMLGIATGKGLDIKGKSAKKGNISSYVPFIQIYEEAHKEHIRALIKDGRVIRVFYQTEAARSEAHEMILDIKDFMLFAAEDAMRVLSDEYADEEEQNLAMKHLMYDDTNLAVEVVDDYANSSDPVFGLDVTERLFWESYVMMQDCSRLEGTEWDIGRNSEPTFMDMNFKAIRHEPGPGDPRAVVYQKNTYSPMEPRTLLMAYEEHGRVKPVVSDFDCFLLGSRGVRYENPIPPEQVELVKWSVKNIKEVLDERASSNSTAGWMNTWFKVLKKAAVKGYYPKTPKYGNGDPKSYDIIQVAVDRLKKTGCVRHGAECFNWFFPQVRVQLALRVYIAPLNSMNTNSMIAFSIVFQKEIDDELLVISDTLPGNVKWLKVNPQQLQEILIEKIDEGFTFPINPKWVLCDPGWRRVYDKLIASQKPNVQDSINCWLPPETGLREEIDEISARHPLGFEGVSENNEGTEMMDQMEDDLERYVKIQRAWRKLRLLLFWIRFVNEKRREREELGYESKLSLGND